MAEAQNQWDAFVPYDPPGRWDWCPQCGMWRPPGECPGCQKREERLRLIRPYLQEYLEAWLKGIQDPVGFLLEGYRARRERLLQEGNIQGLLAMEQAEEEFAASVEKRTGEQPDPFCS